ncbi:hypothetical protein FLAPXU55_04763 [Flavobacterium panici]|uniref:Uncharacterized protein n=1 Tax=Flavobacterium panici TaxID=2654843 RepID=A0A9N8J624_9FLAO|nr:hypothetical protein FLAPXU55_04763 [Flavobacterium panici]
MLIINEIGFILDQKKLEFETNFIDGFLKMKFHD